MNMSIRNIGGSIGVAVTATIVTAPKVGDWPAGSGYTNWFAMLSGALGISAIAALLIPATRPPRVKRAPDPDPRTAAQRANMAAQCESV
jgi:hypothetical protein